MLKRFLFLIFIFTTCVCYAQDVTIDGHTIWDTEILNFNGMDEPSTAPLGDARIYFDSTANKLKVSENAGSYTNLLLTQEEIDDYIDALINDADSVHTLITITYDDVNDAMDFVVNDDLSLYDNSTSGFLTSESDTLDDVCATTDQKMTLSGAYNSDLGEYVPFEFPNSTSSFYFSSASSNNLYLLGPASQNLTFGILADVGWDGLGSWTPSISWNAHFTDDIVYEDVGGTNGLIMRINPGTLQLQVSGDTDDYIKFQTVSNIPEITTVGDCNLKITSSGGTIDFGDDNLTSTGTIEGATITESGVAVLNTGEYQETHASEHAVGGADTVFPADPNADKFLKWNDTAGNLEWADVSASTDRLTSTNSTLILSDDGSHQTLTGNLGNLKLDAATYIEPLKDFSIANGWKMRNGYVRIGDGGTVNYADGDGDLYVEDELEVDGNAVFDGLVTLRDGSYLYLYEDMIFEGGEPLAFTNKGMQYYRAYILWQDMPTGQNDYLNIVTLTGSEAVSGNIIITDDSGKGKDFGHNADDDPILFIQSNWDTGRENCYIAFWHDQTDANVEAGAGDLNLTPPAGQAVVVSNGLVIPSGTTPSPDVEGALFLDTDASTNGALVIYSNGAWRTVASW